MTNEVQPVVSVLIVTYNQERFIARAIEGALAQWCDFPVEIVIGDDCSTDRTAAICRDYEQRCPGVVRLVSYRQNKGVLANYCNTLRECRGEFIADCAGDDFWADSRKLQRQVERLRRNPGLSMVFSDYAQCDESGHITCPSMTGYGSDMEFSYASDIYRLMDQHGKTFVFTGSACFRKETFLSACETNPIFFRGFPCEDFQLVFFMLRAGNIYYENRVTACYRVLSNTVSHHRSLRKMYEFEFGVFRLRTELILRFGLDAGRCSGYLESALRGLLSMTVKYGTDSRRKELLSIYGELLKRGYRPQRSVRMYAAVASSRFTQLLFRPAFLLLGKKKA